MDVEVAHTGCMHSVVRMLLAAAVVVVVGVHRKDWQLEQDAMEACRKD